MKCFSFLILLLLISGCAINTHTKKDKVTLFTDNTTSELICGDAESLRYYPNKRKSGYLSKVKFTKSGLDKICFFTKNNINKEFGYKINRKIVQLGLLIKSPIGCNSNSRGIGFAFNNMEELNSFAKTLCIE